MYRTMQEIKSANQKWATKNQRVCWFEPGAMSFFSTQLHDRVYGGHLFITSEQYEATEYGKTYLGFTDGPRKFTVRTCNPDGSIDTIGEFQAYDTLQHAEEAVKGLY